jgi:iron complex outermembrane receptor protein
VSTGAARVAALAAALGLSATRAAAQPACATIEAPAGVVADGSRGWPAPLDRVVASDPDARTLRAVLDRLSEVARVRFSYSPDLLPLERRVCVRAGRASLGDLLRDALAGTGALPVVAGPDQVVLAPALGAAAIDAAPTLARSTGRLERVVVTGTATGGSERASPFGLTVLDRRALDRTATQSMAQTFDASVPGLWLWAQSPTTLVARYGSVRGASSFGVSTPKVYIDGIEVANPLLLTQLDPARVQRVEVIRGPQGAALYGADAISGVVQIVTRHDGVGPGAPRTELRVGAGSSTSAFTDRGVLAQEHALSLRAGRAARSASLGVTLTTLGAYVPGAEARQLLAHASTRVVGARSVVSGTARFYAADAASPQSPLLADLSPTGAHAWPRRASWLAQDSTMRPPRDSTYYPTARVDSTGEQRARQYTLGGTATLHSSTRWTHALTAGVDGYRLAGVAAEGMLVPSVIDSALRAARGGADRLTLRANSTARLGDPSTRGLAVTFALEHSTARETTNGAGSRLAVHGGPAYGAYAPTQSGTRATSWWSNTGVLGQGELSLGNSLFVNGGTRLEYISGPSFGTQLAVLPMLGTSWVREAGAWTGKLRGAYGRGIRPARTVARGATWSGGRGPGALTSLEPEEQSGVEVGADLLWRGALGVHVTRFDQRASGLVQPVATVVDTAMRPGPGTAGRAPRLGYELQNVGAIDNRGWELQATGTVGPLNVAATVSLVDSRVARLASGYRGDLRTGDRILEVPARTLGLTAGWTARRWSLSGTAARAADWINYDRLALADAMQDALVVPTASGPRAPGAPVGGPLRAFWRRYDGRTRVGARGSVAVWGSTALTLSVDNLLNHQVGEPDNVSVLPGRTLTAGLRTGF